MEGLQEVTNALSIFWVAAIFLLPVSPLRSPRRPFCLNFARTAKQSLLHGTNRPSSGKPCAYCRIVHRADIFAIAQLSCFGKRMRLDTRLFVKTAELSFTDIFL